MEEIKQIERVLGKEYGKQPCVVPNTWPNRYADYVKQKFPNLITGVLGGLIIASAQTGDGFYRGKDHTIWVPKEQTPFTNFAVLHELVHGYNRQVNPKLQEIDDTVANEGINSWLGGHFSSATIEQALLYRAVDEGIADYVAIQTQKLEVQECRKKVDEVYCFEREWVLVHFKNPEDGQTFNASTPLNHRIAKQLDDIGQKLIGLFLSANSATGLERIKKSMTAVNNLSWCAYLLGHYLVRVKAQDKQECIGEDVDALIKNPPASVKELQDIVLSSF